MHSDERAARPADLAPETLERVTRLLESLASAEYWLRKYRTRGDARGGSSSSDYHSMARTERLKADGLVAELDQLLGPGGGPAFSLSRPVELAGQHARILRSIDDTTSFEDACFFARHPAWADRVERYRSAHERWRADPRFQAFAPHFLPVYSGWTD